MLQNFPLYAYIPAKDVARARRFYESKLGFQPIPLKNATLKCCCAPRHLSMLGYVWQSEVSA